MSSDLCCLSKLTNRVIPITESMKEPRKFPAVLSGVMLIVAILFAGSGVLGYAAYGSDIQTVVIVNLPQDDKFVQAVQFLCELNGNLPSVVADSRLHCHPAFHPFAAFPSCANHGEWTLFPVWKAQPCCQMAEESVPGGDGALLNAHLMGGFIRAGQVCIPHRSIRLVRLDPVCCGSCAYSQYPALFHLPPAITSQSVCQDAHGQSDRLCFAHIRYLGRNIHYRADSQKSVCAWRRRNPIWKVSTAQRVVEKSRRSESDTSGAVAWG